ncbi:MAG: serine hydrolase [Lachnospiraceae bacterium]|nr:serine hydrolase [Lachnospiraceae bacterium]
MPDPVPSSATMSEVPPSGRKNRSRHTRFIAGLLAAGLSLSACSQVLATPAELSARETDILRRFIPGYQLMINHSFSLPDKSLALLRVRLEKLLSNLDGEWSVCILDLETREEMIINDVSMPSASEMKLFILGTVYDAIQSGDLERTSELVAQLSSMVRVSSNTDANRLLQTLGNGNIQDGIRKVNDYIQKAGFSELTHAYNGFQDESLIFDAKHMNCTSTKDLARLLSMIYHRTFSIRKNCNEAEEWMLNQDIRYKIPAAIPDKSMVGNKTGETDDTENDAAVIYSPARDYILCVLSHGWSSKTDAQKKITEISDETYRYFNDTSYRFSATILPPILLKTSSDSNNLDTDTLSDQTAQIPELHYIDLSASMSEQQYSDLSEPMPEHQYVDLVDLVPGHLYTDPTVSMPGYHDADPSDQIAKEDPTEYSDESMSEFDPTSYEESTTEVDMANNIHSILEKDTKNTPDADHSDANAAADSNAAEGSLQLSDLLANWNRTLFQS